MVIVKDPSEYLNGLFVISEKITELKFKTEALYKDGKYGKKLECLVICNDKAETEKNFSLNNTNHRLMMKLISADTADWVGKTVSITTGKVQTSDGLKDSIYIGDKV